MMRHEIPIVLIHAAPPAASAFEQLGRSQLPPLGVLYLASSLDSAGFPVQVIDLALEKNLDQAVRMTIALHPKIVGISTLAQSYPIAHSMALRFRADLSQDAMLIAGGADATVRPFHYLKTNSFDAILVGEAEKTITELARAWPAIPAIQGILLPDMREAIAAERIVPDDAPFPARRLLPIKHYRGGPAYKQGRNTTSIFTHRGCPYSCTFCEKGVHEGPIRFRGAESIWREVQEVRKEFGIHDIRFIDDVFTVNREILNDFLERVLRSGEKFRWMCCSRLDLAREDVLRAMRAAGCYRIEYGVESGSERVLGLIEKRLDLARAAEAIRMTRRAGIESIANFVIGFPTETEHEIRQTMKFSRDLDPDWAIFFPFLPFEGAPLSRKFGLRWVNEAPAFRAPSPVYPVDATHVLDLVDESYRGFYFRPRTILRRLAGLRSVYVLWDLVRMAVAHVVGRVARRMDLIAKAISSRRQ